MKKTSLSVSTALAGLILLGTAATAQSGTQSGTASKKVQRPWLVRLRALQLDPVNHSDSFTALGTNFPANAVHVNTKTFPEADISYFFTQYIAAELIATYPQKQYVSLAGVGRIGRFDHLPPTLTAQYHFASPDATVQPYLGAGVNYTRITSQDIAAGGVPLGISKDSFGFAYQAGLDYKVAENVYLNLDYKHLGLGVDVKVRATGQKLTSAQLDPNLFAVGIGYRFK